MPPERLPLDTIPFLRYVRAVKTFLLCLLVISTALAENAPTTGLTNRPIDPNSAILAPTIPEAVVPITPQPYTLTIPSSTDTPPPPKKPAPATQSPFRNQIGLQPPTARDIAKRTVTLAPPKLPPVTPLPSDNSPPVTPDATESKTRYVSPTGDDANPGTETSPWKTLQHAATSAQPGFTILVAPGTYEPFHTVQGGTADQPITFRAEGEVIVGTAAPEVTPDQPVAPPKHRNNIEVRDTDYIIIDGFQVQHAKRTGIAVIESRGVILRNNIVSHSGVFGILTGFSTDVQIISNKTFNTGEQHGIYVSNSRVPDDKPIILYNESYRNGGSGIQFNGDCAMGGDGILSGALIEGNILRDNGLKGLSLISTSNSVVQNNLSYNNGRFGAAAGIHLADEEGCGRPSCDNIIVNNTVVEPRMPALRFTDGARNNIIFNNLLISTRPIHDEVKDNRIDLSSNVTLDSAIGVFNNPEAGDYHLLLVSPAKDVGVMSFHGQTAPNLDREGHRRRHALGYNAGAY